MMVSLIKMCRFFTQCFSPGGCMASHWLSHRGWVESGLPEDSSSPTGKTATELELRSHIWSPRCPCNGRNWDIDVDPEKPWKLHSYRSSPIIDIEHGPNSRSAVFLTLSCWSAGLAVALVRRQNTSPETAGCCLMLQWKRERWCQWFIYLHLHYEQSHGKSKSNVLG